MIRHVNPLFFWGTFLPVLCALAIFPGYAFSIGAEDCFVGLSDYERCVENQAVNSEGGEGQASEFEGDDEEETSVRNKDSEELNFSFFMSWVVDFLKAVSAPLVVFVTYFLLRKKISLYLLRDVVESKVNEMLRAQDKVKKCIPEYFENIEDRLSSVSSPVALAGDEDFEFLLEYFGEISDFSVEAPGNVATYSRLSELVLVQVQEVERMRCKKESDSNSGEFSSGGKVGRIRKDLLYRRALGFCNLIEYSSLRTVPVPQVKTKKISLLPDVRNKKLSGDSSEFIGGLSQGAFVRHDHIYCAEFFYQALTPFVRRDYCFHKAFFMLVGNNRLLSLELRRKGFLVPLELNLSDIDRTEEERKNPDVVDMFGDNKIFLIGWNEVDHFDGEGSSQQIQLYYTCLQGNKFFLRKYAVDKIERFFLEKSGVKAVSINIYPDDMVIKIQVKRKDVSFGFLRKNFNRYVRPLRSL